MSTWLDLWEGHNIDYEVMDYFQDQTYRLQDKEIVERIKTTKRYNGKAREKRRRDQEKNGTQKKKEGMKPKKQSKEPSIPDGYHLV